MESRVRTGAALASVVVLLTACSAAAVPVDPAVAEDLEPGSITSPAASERSRDDRDVLVFWTGPDGRSCSTHMVLEVELSELTQQEAVATIGSPGFATSLDDLVREVLAPGTALGRPPTWPQYVEDFASALAPDADDEQGAASSKGETTYTDEALAADPQLRESLILEPTEPEQELTTTMVDIREAAAQASAQREFLEGWETGAAVVDDEGTFTVLQVGDTSMRVEAAHGVHALVEFSHRVDCYASRFDD